MNCECWTLPTLSQDSVLKCRKLPTYTACLERWHRLYVIKTFTHSLVHPCPGLPGVSQGAEIPPVLKFASKAIILKIHTKPDTPSGVINIICLHCPCEFKEWDRSRHVQRGGAVGAWAPAHFPLDAQSALLSRQFFFFVIKRPFVKACPV